MRPAATLLSNPRGLTAVSLAIVLILAASAAMGAPVHTDESTAGGTPYVTLDKGAASIPFTGSFTLKVDIAVDAPTSYLESRVQIRNPGGRLLYQKTEVRSDVPTGTVHIEYTRDLADLSLKAGVYPIEVRVRTQSGGVRQWLVNDDLLLYDPAGPAVPVAIVVRIESTPSMDAEGRFLVDPAEATQARDEAKALAELVLSDPSKHLTVAIPPVILEEWLRASQGYSVVGVEGVVDVPAEEPVPRAYAEALDTLKRALATGRLELADVPYSEPDVGALQEYDRLPDLRAQLLSGHSAYFAALETSPSAGVVTGVGILSIPATKVLQEMGAEFVVLDAASMESSETTPASGAYRVSKAPGLSALVVDGEFSTSLESAGTQPCTTQVFTRSLSEDPTSPIVAVVRMGPGRRATVANLAPCIADIDQAPWGTFVTATDAAAMTQTESVELTTTIPHVPGAPAGFWDEAAEARRLASAFVSAVGVNDPEAQLASDQSLVAQSALWAGPDLNWGAADRGRAIAAASIRSSSAILDAVTLGVSDITLSGASGEVPVSITNSSTKTLGLELRTKATGMDVMPLESDTVQVRPNENFATIPVDLGQSLSGRLTVQLWADEVLVDETTVSVRASFLDRLVLIGGLALVLVGMLLFIRHRVRSASRADTM